MLRAQPFAAPAPRISPSRNAPAHPRRAPVRGRGGAPRALAHGAKAHRHRPAGGSLPPQQIALSPGEAGRLRVIPLGGCGEVTRSCYIYEYEDDIVIVDMGLQWPDEDMPGIDYLIPNIEYLRPRRDRIRGIVITHGHYDHIGAIPHLLDALGNPPIYATALTRGVILKRQEEFTRARKPEIHVVTPESKVQLGSFGVEFFHVNHNIPDSVGVVLKTPIGTVVHTGDWKFDHTPVNERPADIPRLTQIGDNGVLLLVSESTDAEIPGRQISEADVQKSLEEIFKAAQGRIIAATFASLLTRIQQLIWLSEKYNRKVLIEGHSMKENVAVATALRYLSVKKGTLIEAKELHNYPDERVTIACTGAQGEDRAVLMRIANGEHKTISLKPRDSVIFSSSVIPGNEATVQRLKDVLFKKASKVYHYATMDIHAGGHAKRDELKQMIELTRPRFFMPIHGTYFMLKLHAELAVETGIAVAHAIIAEDGEIVSVGRNDIKKLSERAPTDYVMVDGLGVGDVKEIVLRDRQHLAGDGIFVIIAIVDAHTGRVRTSPDIISRGFIYLKESQDLLKDVRQRTRKIVEDTTVGRARPINWTHVRDNLREEIGQYLFQKTQRRPMVLPVVIEV